MSVITLKAPTAEDKEKAKSRIDEQAETARLQYLTAGSGQAQEYAATRNEAEQAVANGEPLDADDYPMLQAEVDALADVGQSVTLLQVAQGIMQNEVSQWLQVGAEIKKIRRSAKLRIDAATTADEVQAILDGVTWPEPG